jgi:ribosomal protein S18 acetylase RimI-like enzyme
MAPEPHVSLRLDTVPDWPAVGALHQAAWLETFGTCAFTAEESAATWRAASDARVRIAYLDDHAVGFLAWQDESMELHITDLYVRPDHRRRGVGRSLVEATIRDSARSMRLEVAEDNPAQRLYRNYGFVETGNLVSDRQGRQLVEMRRRAD